MVHTRAKSSQCHNDIICNFTIYYYVLQIHIGIDFSLSCPFRVPFIPHNCLPILYPFTALFISNICFNHSQLHIDTKPPYSGMSCILNRFDCGYGIKGSVDIVVTPLICMHAAPGLKQAATGVPCIVWG